MVVSLPWRLHALWRWGLDGTGVEIDGLVTLTFKVEGLSLTNPIVESSDAFLYRINKP